MKTLASIIAIAAFSIASSNVAAQDDKSKKPSPPASVTQTIKSGATVTIHYNQPSVKGRTIGKDLDPFKGKIWRTGANEATTFTVDKDVKVNGSALPAGKYALFTIADDNEWTVIFNKVAEQWGAYKYDETKDALRIKAKASQSASASEKLTFTVTKEGQVNILWGNNSVAFSVE